MSTNQNLMQHMRELIERIKAADVAYYRDDNPTMTDREYDLLVDELKELETTTGLILSGSPTQTVSGEILKELTPVRHTKPMLSADKTKSVDEMLRFANGRPVVLSWKLDGLTLVLRYEDGEFKQAITRGREGIIGEDVTHTVRTFMNVPMCIPCADKFEVRGEGVISWAHFEKINLSLSEPYSHPRNLAAGSVRMLDARESGKRYLEFFAFDLISDSIEEHSKAAQLQFLAENGFDVVPYVYTDTHDVDELRKLIADFKPAEYGYPVDGVIMEYDNLVYGRSLLCCGDCGGAMVRKTQTSGNKRFCYYTCSNHKNTGECTSHRISQKQLEDAVLRLLQEHIRMLAELDGCLQTIRNAPVHRLSIRKAEERLAAVEADIDRYRKLKISAYEDMRDGILSKEDYLDIKAQYEMRISEAQLAEEQIRHEIDLYIENGNAPQRWLQEFLDHRNIQSLTRIVAVECIDHIMIYEGKRIEVTFAHMQDYEALVSRVKDYYINQREVG